MKNWQCSVCRYIHKMEDLPDKCPVCNAPASKFQKMDETSISETKSSDRTSDNKPTFNNSSEGNIKQNAKQSYFNNKRLEKIISFMIRHHAHPVSVHTPNGILPASVLLFILSWIFDLELLSKAGFINLIIVLISIPVVICTGLLEWQQKYNKAMTSIFKIKMTAAAITTITSIMVMVWYILNPSVLSEPKAWLFIGLNMIMLASAGIAGYIGGKLVFKD